VKRAIKQDPRLWNAYTRLRAALGARSGSPSEEGTESTTDAVRPRA